MSDDGQTVEITVDGRTVAANPGELLIDACERTGTYIPRFCHHPRMQPVGMCRACLVEVDDVLVGEFLERHFHHAHRTLYDLRARGDDRASLLPLEHGRGDLRRVGQMGDPCFEDLYTRFVESALDLGL